MKKMKIDENGRKSSITFKTKEKLFVLFNFLILLLAIALVLLFIVELTFFIVIALGLQLHAVFSLRHLLDHLHVIRNHDLHTLAFLLLERELVDVQLRRLELFDFLENVLELLFRQVPLVVTDDVGFVGFLANKVACAVLALHETKLELKRNS